MGCRVGVAARASRGRWFPQEPALDDSYQKVNRRAWAELVEYGSPSSRPFGPAGFARARSWLDDRGWIPWDEVSFVLCLASGGGQQAPLFAALGRQVTLVDLSPEQLQLDRD